MASETKIGEREPVAWQRRPIFSEKRPGPGPWEPCSAEEAAPGWNPKRRNGYIYRALYTKGACALALENAAKVADEAAAYYARCGASEVYYGQQDAAERIADAIRALPAPEKAGEVETTRWCVCLKREIANCSCPEKAPEPTP